MTPERQNSICRPPYDSAIRAVCTTRSRRHAPDTRRDSSVPPQHGRRHQHRDAQPHMPKRHHDRRQSAIERSRAEQAAGKHAEHRQEARPALTDVDGLGLATGRLGARLAPRLIAPASRSPRRRRRQLGDARRAGRVASARIRLSSAGHRGRRAAEPMAMCQPGSAAAGAARMRALRDMGQPVERRESRPATTSTKVLGEATRRC